MNFQLKKSTSCRTHRHRSAAGFTLLEFLVAMVMFLVLGAAIMDMFAKQAPYFTRQQNLAGVNIAMQNAVSQMQLDLVNAGTGYYPGTVISSWPIGVTIKNQLSTNGACNNAATFTYTATCFDTLNILTLNPNTPPAHPTDNTGGTTGSNCNDLSNAAGFFYIQPNFVAGKTVAQELALTAAGYTTGDQLLLVTSSSGGSHATIGAAGAAAGTSSNASSRGVQVNSFVLTGPPVIGASTVALPFTPVTAPATQAKPYLNDPLNISTSDSTNLGYWFCPQDWVMKLEPTVYSVDVTTNPQNPTLTRKFGNNPADTIAEQIIGFKVGAATWNPNASADRLTYSFYAKNQLTDSPPGYTSDFEEVRSVRVSMIGRTNPNPDPTYTFRNSFDGGPYQVVDATVVINPRNITMNNQ
jgi:type II secretory pathway pseudopilin PulG